MQQLKELEREVSALAVQVNAPSMAFVGPKQFHGIEVSIFAVELTSMVVWIGYLQWTLANGPGNVQTPILEKLDTIVLHDALINDDGSEYEWPNVDYVIGNPPFLGGKLLRSSLGDAHINTLFNLFEGRVPHEADLVCYWFEKARAMIADKRLKRAGLLATNSIRSGANRETLKRINDTGSMFMAWSDEPWILNGAAVRVSIIGFDDGTQTTHTLDGTPVPSISSSLSPHLDLSTAHRLRANAGQAYMGTTMVGPFNIDEATARQWMASPNPSGISNKDVIRKRYNATDLMRGWRHGWVIDFADMPEDQAAHYLVPFQHVREHVKPLRDKNKRASYRRYWWQFGESRPALRKALRHLARYIATPAHSKHRVFVWLDAAISPDHALHIFPTESTYTFGVLHSTPHKLWALRQGSWIGKGNDPRYTPTTCFETYPFPQPTPQQRHAVEEWAQHVDTVRQGLLDIDPKLTITKLYNEVGELREHRDSTHRAYPLLLAHENLDTAVAAAYGWEWPLEEEEILRRLLELNHQRAAEEAKPASY